MEKYKVGIVTNHFEITGISSVILNYCENIDKSKFEFTIFAGSPISEKNALRCQQNGINLIVLPPRKSECFKHYYKLYKELKNNSFDIIHVHGNSSMMAIELTIAWLCGIKTRIAHSHNTVCQNMIVHKLINRYFKMMYTKALACGMDAGEWLFGKNNFEVLPNAIDVSKFCYDEKIRNEIRDKYDLNDKYVIGHIGRFNEQKNHKYLIKIFSECIKYNDSIYMMLVGEGPIKKEIEKMIKLDGLESRVILCGGTSVPEQFYSAFDAFVLPSLYEGLPVVLLEAQLSGLLCYVSDTITKEMDAGEINWFSIKENPSKCALLILNHINEYRNRKETFNLILSQFPQYNIKVSSKKLENIYLHLLKCK